MNGSTKVAGDASPPPPRTAFVLSGGGSLGAVQVGMLQALGAAGAKPDLLIGTSAGALNSAWVATHGMSVRSLAELADVWRTLRRRDVFAFSPARAIGAVLGANNSAFTSAGLGRVIRDHIDIEDIADAAIELHVLATDLRSGSAVRLSAGPVVDAVMASAAVPGLYPPVRVAGRYLVDGAVAHQSGVEHAVALGARAVWVLPTGHPCALDRPPQSALGVALQALTLLTQDRLITGVGTDYSDVTVKVLPPLCPLAVSAADFGHAEELIDRARDASMAWLAAGNDELPDQERFLSLHDHTGLEPRTDATLPIPVA
jgi:NTE family protein